MVIMLDKYKTKKANLDDLSINIVFGSVKSNVLRTLLDVSEVFQKVST